MLLLIFSKLKRLLWKPTISRSVIYDINGKNMREHYSPVVDGCLIFIRAFDLKRFHLACNRKLLLYAVPCGSLYYALQGGSHKQICKRGFSLSQFNRKPYNGTFLWQKTTQLSHCSRHLVPVVVTFYSVDESLVCRHANEA